MQIDTIDDLKKLVSKDESKGRTKFVVKIFHVLQFVRLHPEKIHELGAAWCEDGRHFIVNSNILGGFLGLKANSINTNFRDHGFQILSSSSQEIKNRFPTITETRHWKLRLSSGANFHAASTIEEAENIPCLQQKVDNVTANYNSAPDKELPFLPKETIQLIGEDQAQMLNICRTYYSLKSTDFYKKFMAFVTKFWKERISETNVSNIENIISAIVNRDEQQLEVNLDFLLQQHDDSSQMNETVTFDTFVRYFIRYGDVSDPALTLREVSSTNTPFDFSGLNIFSSQNYELNVQFHSWFSPTADKNYAVSALQQTFGQSWVVIHSKTPNVFNLLFKHNLDVVRSLHIFHNPIPDNPNERYYVQFNNGEFQYRSSLDEILTGVLKLSYKTDYEKRKIPDKPLSVNADDIIALTDKPESQENIFDAHSSLHFTDDSQLSYFNSQIIMDTQTGQEPSQMD